MDMYKVIGNKIRYIRKQKKLTQQQLAEKADISLPFMGHIERGTRKMSLETFRSITRALECSADELLATGCCATPGLRALVPTIVDLLERAVERLCEEEQDI